MEFVRDACISNLNFLEKICRYSDWTHTDISQCLFVVKYSEFLQHLKILILTHFKIQLKQDQFKRSST